jgi:hypothetical protein
MNEVVIPLKIQGIAQMKAELRELKGSIASATDPAQMTALAQQAGVLSDRIKDANDAVAVFASGSKFEQVSNGLGGIKDSLMSLDFEEAAEKSKTFATALGTINKADIAKSMKGIVDMTKTLTGAFLKLGMTILMNPIFLIVAAVVAIIAVIALVLKSFGVLDDVINAMMMPINALIAGFKALTDWLGLTAFAAEENAARTLAANEKVTESSKERTASMTADLGREIAEAKAAGEDTTKLEEEKSNVQIKEADKRRGTAYKALAAQRKLGEDADQETIKKLKKQIREENEIIKQGYSDKKVAKLNDIKADAAADAAAAKEAAARAKQYASDRLNARRDIRKQEIGLSGSDMEQERLTIINDHKVKLEDIKNNAALTKAEKIRLQELENQLFEEKKREFTAKQAAIDKENNDKKKEADAKAITDAIALEDAKYLELVRLRDGQAEADKLQAQQEFDKKTEGLKSNDELYLLYLKEYQNKIKKINQDTADANIAIDNKAHAEKMKNIEAGLKLAQTAGDAIAFMADTNISAQLKRVKKGSKEEEALLKKQFEQNKKAQLAAAFINAAQAQVSILAQYPKFDGGFAMVAAMAGAAITSAMTIAKISSTSLSGGGSNPDSPDSSLAATTAVAPASGPSLFGQANTGSQINAEGNSNQNITVTAVVSETEMTATQHFINNIQQNSVL